MNLHFSFVCVLICPFESVKSTPKNWCYFSTRRGVALALSIKCYFNATLCVKSTLRTSVTLALKSGVTLTQ